MLEIPSSIEEVVRYNKKRKQAAGAQRDRWGLHCGPVRFSFAAGPHRPVC
jgi:hypothetical protein